MDRFEPNLRIPGPTALPASVASAANATSAYVAMPTAQRLIDTRLSTALPAGGSLSVSVTVLCFSSTM